MNRILAVSMPAIAVLMLASSAIAAIPPEARTLIERLTSRKGTYVADEGVYKIVFPREEAAIVTDDRTLSPNLGLNSWAAFASGIHHEAILTGEFLLLEDEVNSVLSKALNSGLQVTGLAASSLFEGAHLQTLNVTGVGTFQNLASAFRKGLDEIRRLRSTADRLKKSVLPAVPLASSIDGGPLDAVLSMRGIVIGGVYKGAIGRKAMLNGELIGREMGIGTWVSIAGTNHHAVAQGEFVETADGLQKLLKALREKDVNIISIRNHTLSEHPQFIFVRFWREELPSTWPRRCDSCSTFKLERSHQLRENQYES